ncbi:MAG: ribonuclease H family protein [Butyribacter sp.]|nr:ribonuclease H family protein [bacterium]MDY3855437.1 ribonuclease H family protein [Butyribacter sp.]
MGKKIYAVRKGRQTGLFATWAECQKQVTGYSGAEFKGFATKEEAMAFLGGGSTQNIKKTVNDSAVIANDTIISDGVAIPNDVITGDSVATVESDAAIAYVDGSYDKISGDFSYGMVILYQQEEQTFCERIHDEELAKMHNVAGEIKGAEAAMRYALEHHFSKLVIYHDYEGIAKWCTGAWKANKEGTKAYKAYYDSICTKVHIEFVKVKGHSNDKYNDMADHLAKQALGIA